MTAASAHCRQKHRKAALSILKKHSVPALCSCHIRIVRGALLSVRLFSSFVKTATAGAGFAVLLHPHPSHVQKHIPACPDQEFDYI